MKAHLVIVAAALALGHAQGACLSDEQARAVAESFFSRQPAEDLPPMNEADARCTRAKINALLAARHGPAIGYKVGLTNPAIRRMLKGDGPAWGALYQGMLLPHGSQVSAAFGARPTVEADLLVRVRSADIQYAKTPLEVLQALDQVIPFIELPDMLVATPLKLDAHGIAALNMAARLGVAGTPIAVPPDRAAQEALVAALGTMKLTMTDGSGKVLGRGVGSDLMDHPLHAAVWLVQALGREGIKLQPGQYISLGSFPPVMPPRPGLKFTVAYEGLPGADPVSVQFTD